MRKENYSTKLFIRFLYDAKMQGAVIETNTAITYVKLAGSTRKACQRISMQRKRSLDKIAHYCNNWLIIFGCLAKP